MKKLFIFVIALGLFWGGKAYSACTWQGDDTATATCVKNANDNTSKCTWGGDLTTCTTFDPTAFAGSQTACDTSKQAQAVARIKLCGSLANYDTSKNRCADSTPKGRGGGIWGYFQQTCFSDNFGGSCVYPSSSYYYFIHGTVAKQNRCGSDDVWRGCADIPAVAGQTEPPAQEYCSAGLECLVGDPQGGADRYESRWLVKYGGWDKPIKDDKVRRHSSSSSWNSGQEMSKVTTDDVAVDQHSSGGPGIDVDGSRASTCNNICGKYWTLKATANDSSTLVAAQGTLDAMCPSVCTTAECICTADPKCDCETNNQGHWLATTKKCICKGLTGSAWDECLCTQGSGGIFINGHCDNKGSGNLPTYDSNGNPVNSGSTAGNDSTGTASDQASISSAGTPSTAGLAGLGGGNAGAIAGAGTGKSWYEQLQHEFGMAGSGAGQKFDAGRGGNYGTPGGGSSSTNKGTNLGIYLSNIDLFTMVSSTYTSQYTNGSIAAPTISNKNASKQKNRLGTKPVSF